MLRACLLSVCQSCVLAWQAGDVREVVSRNGTDANGQVNGWLDGRSQIYGVCMRGRMESACCCMVVQKYSLGRLITVSPFLSFTRPGCISGSNRWVWTSRGTLSLSLSPPSISPASHCSITHTQVKHTALAPNLTRPNQKEAQFSVLVLHTHTHSKKYFQ